MTVHDSTLIRIPLALKADLEAEAATMLRIYQEGKGTLPAEHCQHVPIHYVITKALEDMRAKRGRSRAPKRPAARKA